MYKYQHFDERFRTDGDLNASLTMTANFYDAAALLISFSIEFTKLKKTPREVLLA